MKQIITVLKDEGRRPVIVTTVVYGDPPREKAAQKGKPRR
jgi:hypothetical protein